MIEDEQTKENVLSGLLMYICNRIFLGLSNNIYVEFYKGENVYRFELSARLFVARTKNRKNTKYINEIYDLCR